MLYEELLKKRQNLITNGQTCARDNGLHPLASERHLFKNYIERHCSVHLHFTVNNGKGPKFCIKINRDKIGHRVEVAVTHDEIGIVRSVTCTQHGKKDVPMLVHVCEGLQNPETGLMRVARTVVRLQALDDFDCLRRHPPKRVPSNGLIELKTAVGDRKGVPLVGRFFSPQGELAHQVIKARMSGLEAISEEEWDAGGHRFLAAKPAPGLLIRFVLALYDEFGAISANISETVALHNFKVALRPKHAVND